jgi:hypothetical protein
MTTVERWTDPEGHAWPVTGYECTICGLPLDPALVRAGFTDHGETEMP